MLKPSLSKFTDHEGNNFYLFNVQDEEIKYSIPLTTSELMIMESCLGGCLYQGVEDIKLEFCNMKSDKKNYIYITFITQVPMICFKLQRAELLNIYNKIHDILESM